MITMMYGYGWHMGFWQAGLSWISMIALWAILVGVVYLLVTRRRPPRSDHWTEIQRTLDRRLASGEIDEAEYRRVRDLISGHRDQAEVTSTSGWR
ncbi:MAG TPA: hypothetical protein VFI65_24920 [Streptosporangiaceae bacterium]|nr:hypothetical protein [Streptosporangiaceae bacterium]